MKGERDSRPKRKVFIIDTSDKTKEELKEIGERLIEKFRTRESPPEPPKPPLNRHILEDMGYFTGFATYCSKCGSTIKKTWAGIGRPLGCVHPDCEDYYA